MEDYFASKQLLFTEYMKSEGETFAILNVDDPQVAATRLAPAVQKMTFGTRADCDFSFTIESETISGMTFSLTEKNLGSTTYKTSLIGRHNVYNIVGAVAAARALGVTHAHCQRALGKFAGIPGRLQRVPTTKNINAFVDYAHTPDALEKVLQALRTLAPQAKIITVFGCGGDRDPGKRPIMGSVALKFSDQLVITSDNPRSEDPMAIIADVVKGFAKGTDPAKTRVEPDREKALAQAATLAKDGDVILIAGKGHEDYQIIGTQTLAFSDFEKMKTILNRT